MIWVFMLFFALALLKTISNIIGERKRRSRAIKKWKKFQRRPKS